MHGLDISSGKGEYAHLHHDNKYAGGHCYHDYAKKGTANTALGLGIAGTVLGGAALLKEWGRKGFGHDGGYGYGHWGGHGHWGHPVSIHQNCNSGGHREHGERHECIGRFELLQSERIASLEAVIAREKAERCSENGDFRLYREFSDKLEGQSKEFNYRFGKIEAQLCENAINDAKMEGRLDVLKEALIEAKIDAAKSLKAAIALEAERRSCGDERIVEWANCKFAETHKFINPHQICPPVELKRFADDDRERRREGSKKD